VSMRDQNGQTNLRRRFMNVDGLAQYLGMQSSWIYDRTGPSSRDRIPHFKMGKYLKFDIQSEAFQAWLNRNFKNYADVLDATTAWA